MRAFIASSVRVVCNFFHWSPIAKYDMMGDPVFGKNVLREKNEFRPVNFRFAVQNPVEFLKNCVGQ
jgi:hypothetical protein